MQVFAQHHLGCPAASSRSDTFEPIRHARTCSVRRLSTQYRRNTLGSTQSVSLSKNTVRKFTARQARQCCTAQAQSQDRGIDLPHPQVSIQDAFANAVYCKSARDSLSRDSNDS